MEIKTGEGKSIIFGIMSLMLALLGNEVYCVCYSNYLKDRDYKDFKNLFEAYDVSDRIKYGTFGEIAENLINENGNIRTLSNNLF